MSAPPIRDLALVGDRHTAALLDRKGSVVWYCPGRFDSPALLAGLLDAARGGAWVLEDVGPCQTRRYLGSSAVLETTFGSPESGWPVTDFMPMGEALPRGVCRRLGPTPHPRTLRLRPAPDYARRAPRLRPADAAVSIDGRWHVYASHPLTLAEGAIVLTVPSGEAGWMFLSETTLSPPTEEDVNAWQAATLEAWQVLTAHEDYDGPYARRVADSLRALRLLTHAPSGGIIAAPTTSLPEVVGGRRNYDYRYVWLRDAAMIVSALTRFGRDGEEALRFLSFICGSERDLDGFPLAPFYTLSGKVAGEEVTLDLAGYRGSRPVRIGNDANVQLQLDAYGNVLLAAKLVYQHCDTRAHWGVVEQLADYLAAHWQEPDYGIWEERKPRMYTTGKVLAACGLEYIAEFGEEAAQAQRWRDAAAAIRRYVEAECLNGEGAYAAVAGEAAVDLSAVLYPVWGYTDADTPAMRATLAAVERDLAAGPLYRRHLERFDEQREGAFLAGTFWMAQYWVMRDPARARAILDAGLEYANDLGLFAEEADPTTGALLGNFPQSFVHASFIGAVFDLHQAERNEQ